jgi:antibiotic biosynthesis monooxygenase (ABM) superfamily enzyme
VLNAPRLVIVSAAVAGIVVLMTYVIMPVLTVLTAGWLCGSFKQTKEQIHD